MDKAQQVHTIRKKYTTGKAIWTRLEQEWEAENNLATASISTSSQEVHGQPDISNVCFDEDPSIEWLEDDEDVRIYRLCISQPDVLNDSHDEEQFVEWLEEEEDDHSCHQMSDESDIEDQDEYSEFDRAHKNQVFVETMRLWALKHQITHAAINDFLEAILKTTDFYVPKDSRTFLKTPVGVGKEIENLAGGQMWYKGIDKSLKEQFRTTPPPVDSFELNISMDGIPLHNSGTTQFWPILMQLHGIPDVPIMTIGIFCGTSKPDNAEDYLRRLVTEINDVQDNGVVINGKRISISLRAILADAPARAFIKCVKNHNGIQGCHKCKILGRSYMGRMIFEGTAEARTNEEFRNGDYSIGHQIRPSPLLDIKHLNIVLRLPTSDDLHLVYYGVLRKLVIGFTTGCFINEKWNLDEQDEISGLLVQIKLPAEFQRAVRSLKCLKFWKASEYRTFLHHISVPLLKGRISDRAYHHFKLLVVGITMFSSKIYQDYWKYAGSLLDQFVSEFSSIYDRKFMTYNVHTLLHVQEDVENIGPLPTISTFPAENKYQQIKRFVRTGNNCLSQVVGRIGELSRIETSTQKTKLTYPYIKLRQEEAILHVRSDFVLRQGNRNAWFLTRNNEIVRYIRATELSGTFVIEGHQILKKRAAFTYPCSSEVIFNYIASVDDLSSEIVRINVRDVKCKFVAISLDGGVSFHFSPLTHTFQE
ncbi:uncharacterized protein LOC120904611 [Anopheles arabiensis]|uniref:uncharacterized protein LOC120904611 n=2 Tax=Anopheles arabiensis TaxID=7173 RepID=UPI001AAD0FBA|nr:uncharacterized protein LOC120904611 [Anopheles arabiensis]